MVELHKGAFYKALFYFRKFQKLDLNIQQTFKVCGPHRELKYLTFAASANTKSIVLVLYFSAKTALNAGTTYDLDAQTGDKGLLPTILLCCGLIYGKIQNFDITRSSFV